MKSPQRIAIFRMGHLGDMVVAMPALWTIRRRFPDAHILFLHQEREKGSLAQGMEVLQKGAVYDEAFSYRLSADDKVSLIDILKTLFRLRMRRVDMLVYLPALRTLPQIKRDRLFFKLAGVKRIVGMNGFLEIENSPRGVPLPSVPHVTDTLLAHLERDGIVPDVPRMELATMGLTKEEHNFAIDWLKRQNADFSGPFVGLGPGGKMTANHWPIERYQEVARSIQASRPDATFILFGGPAEREICQKLAKGLVHIVHAAGELSIRQAAAVLEHCHLFIGNDTGITHVAAMSGVRCIAIHGAREWPGKWRPYGEGHRVFRHFVPCEGCRLYDCDRGNLCILGVESSGVASAAVKMLNDVFASS